MENNSLIILIGIWALALLIWNFTISIAIANYLKRHGVKVNAATFHFKIFEHANKYKNITKKETGKTGRLYLLFLLSFILFALVLLVGIIIHSID